ncbi:MAG: hypothetical protein ABIL58_26885 [Pseudomonadota bacterium]
MKTFYHPDNWNRAAGAGYRAMRKEAALPDHRRLLRKGVAAFTLFLLAPETPERDDGRIRRPAPPWWEAIKSVFWMAVAVAASLTIGAHCTP